MIRRIRTKYIILGELILLTGLVVYSFLAFYHPDKAIYVSTNGNGKDYIKWVSFDISSRALEKAYQYDVESQKGEVKINWIELLALLGHKYGGDFTRFREKDMAGIVEKLINKEETVESLSKNLKYYKYYYEAYEAVLGGMVGPYKIEIKDETAPGGKAWVEKYGLKVFSPIARNYPYSHFDDFGVSRSYGFRRKHLGHDMMGQVGSPIIAVESGYIEAIGWNQYGGWRIGIRSFDKKRYYYYAHLRKNFPYNKELKEGSIVQAGDVIGYLGRTGYSSSENSNNISTPHLHFGMQLIFDESQKESNNEIWIDCYNIIKFLYCNRCETEKDPETKEYHRVYQFLDPIAEYYIHHSIYKYEDKEFHIDIYE